MKKYSTILIAIMVLMLAGCQNNTTAADENVNAFDKQFGDIDDNIDEGKDSSVNNAAKELSASSGEQLYEDTLNKELDDNETVTANSTKANSKKTDSKGTGVTAAQTVTDKVATNVPAVDSNNAVVADDGAANNGVGTLASAAPVSNPTENLSFDSGGVADYGSGIDYGADDSHTASSDDYTPSVEFIFE